MSKIPLAIDALLIRLPLWLPSSVRISDGNPLEWLEDDEVVLGWETEDRPSVAVVTEREGLKPGDREQFIISGFIQSTAATPPIKPVRDRAFQWYSAIATGLKANNNLGGVVLSTRLSVADLRQISIETGATAQLTFQITCDAFA